MIPSYLPVRKRSTHDSTKWRRAVSVKADTYADSSFEGKVLRVGTEAEFTPRNVQTRQDRDRLVYAVEVTIPNPERLLRPGMPVEITVVSGAKDAS